ncbi:MAG: DegT/DnrJ/EryC1/StrS family aminotransferase [Bacteriovoracaceae bacterium]
MIAALPYFLFQIFLKDNTKRDDTVTVIRKGIGCSIHYAVPVPMMSYYQKKYQLKADDYKNAIQYGKNPTFHSQFIH